MSNFNLEIKQALLPSEVLENLPNKELAEQINKIRELNKGEKVISFTGKNVLNQLEKQKTPGLPPKDKWADEACVQKEIIERCAKFGVEVQFDEKGLPVNPHAKTGIGERGVLGKYGPNFAIDLAPFVITKKGKILQCVITRKDGAGKAMIGGFLDPEDGSVKAGAFREALEEAFSMPDAEAKKLQEYVEKNAIISKMRFNGDGRNTDNAWMMTSLVKVVLPENANIEVEGKDDATSAQFAKVSVGLYKGMPFANHGKLNLLEWAKTERMLLKEVRKRYVDDFLPEESVKNALQQLQQLRAEITILPHGEGKVYGNAPMPKFSARKEVFEEENRLRLETIIYPNHAFMQTYFEKRIDFESINLKQPPKKLEITGRSAKSHSFNTKFQTNNREDNIPTR